MPRPDLKISHKEEEKEVLDRLRLLQLAEKLGNVAEACRQAGIDRSRFYIWKKRYEKWGIDGLRSKKPKPKSHPKAIPDNIKRKVKELALLNPKLGCNQLSKLLEKQNIVVSASSIHRILLNYQLETREKRALYLFNASQEIGSTLSKEQQSFLLIYFPEK